MTSNGNEYHFSLEWHSDGTTSEPEESAALHADAGHTIAGQPAAEDSPPPPQVQFDPTMVESGPVLRSTATAVPLTSANTSPMLTPPVSEPRPSEPQVQLVPRGYQVELFRRACEENIIAFLETGAGKTLVAALLLKKTLNDLKAAEETAHHMKPNGASSMTDMAEGCDVEMLDKPCAPESDAMQDENGHHGQNGAVAQDGVFRFVAPKVTTVKPRKIAVFLVHRVPLVLQQANVVRSVLSPDQHVGVYYGERGVDDWSASKWARSLRTKNVLVMTAQVFLNLLRHGLLDIRHVALLVIDEVHHATKSHPYRRIFVEFYHKTANGDPRPRVFGMTATPVKRKSASSGEVPCMKAIAALEATLDATVVAVSDKAQAEVETLVPKPEEFVITYKIARKTEGIDEELGEEELVTESAILSKIADLQPNELTRDVSDGSQGEFVDGRLDPDEMSLVTRLFQKLGYKAASDFAKQLCRLSGIRPEITLQDLLKECRDEDIESGGIPQNVSKLLDALFADYVRYRKDNSSPNPSEELKDQFRCIVFVHERTTALSLTWLINSVFGGLDCKELTARSVVGAQNSDSHVRMSQAKLIKTIDDFRHGEYGILVSTNVVEEGLDIPACRLVVAFDRVMSPTAYVQARGRARKKDARYIAFIEEGCPSAYEAMYHARRGAKLMNDVAKGGMMNEVDRRLSRMKYLSDVSEEKTLFSRTTSAKVSATEAVNLLHRYCTMKGQQMNDDDPKPKYAVSPIGHGFIASVTLHKSIPIDGGFCIEKQEFDFIAKRLAALDAYAKLYHIGEVDAHLLPRRPSRSQRVLRITNRASDAGVRVITQRCRPRGNREVQSKASKKHKRIRSCNIKHPKVLQVMEKESCGAFRTSSQVQHETMDVQMSEATLTKETHNPDPGVPKTLFIYSVALDCDMSRFDWYPSARNELFGILVREKVVEEDLAAIKCPFGDVLLTLTYQGALQWDSELQTKAYKYVRCLQLCLRGRTPGSPLALEIEENEYSKYAQPGFFLVPLLRSEDTSFQIDWSSMERLLSFGWRCGPLERHEALEDGYFEHALLCSYHENLDRVYLSGRVHPDLQADSYPNGFINQNYASFTHYFQKKHGVVLNNPTQRMLEGHSVREAMSSLSASSFMLPPETCRVIPLSPMACFITSLLPVWQTFLALRVCWRRNRIHEDPVDFLSFARALQPNINNVAKGAADLSYERLEFLGDAVLKVIYSMVMFVKNPADNEGLLSDERDLEVSNQRLADLAMEMQIQNCVAFSGVSQKVKSWPWFWATHQNATIRISEKVLADCVESLIGAQYLHGGIELATTFMDRHNLLPGACNVMGIKSSFKARVAMDIEQDDGVRVELPPMGPGEKRHESPFVAEVERIIQYSFRDKRHLVVALTHGSYENGLISSYQRYEYLGDAIIGFLLLSYLFQKYPELSPGELTSLRGPALSNDLFARVIVSWGIHKSFWHNCMPLEREIKKFEELVANEEGDEEDISKTMTVPKVLGDLLESIVGAIVVDKGMRLDGVQEIVLRLMDEELNRFANPDKFKHNPVSELVRTVQGRCNTLPRYDYLDGSSDAEKTCAIFVNDEQVGIGKGPTRRVAKRKASIDGLKAFKNAKEGGGGAGLRGLTSGGDA